MPPQLKKATARRHRQQQQQQQQQQWQAPKEGRPDLLLPPLDPQGDGVSGGVREVTTCGGALQALHAPQPWLDGCRDGFLQVSAAVSGAKLAAGLPAAVTSAEPPAGECSSEQCWAAVEVGLRRGAQHIRMCGRRCRSSAALLQGEHLACAVKGG